MPDTLASMGVHLGPDSTVRLLALSDARLHELRDWMRARGIVPDHSHCAGHRLAVARCGDELVRRLDAIEKAGGAE